MRSVDKSIMKSTGKNMSVGRLFLKKFGKTALSGLVKGLRYVVVGLLLAALSQSVYAITDVEITNADGEVVFLLRFFDQADGEYATGYTATRSMTGQEMDSVAEAAQYWVDILKATGTMPVDGSGNSQPVVVNVGYDAANVGNAGAASMGSVKSTVDGYYVERTQALLADGTYAGTGWLVYDENTQEWVGVDQEMNASGAHAFITVGSGWNPLVGNQSQSGRGNYDLGPVIIHEFGHALGISSSATSSYYEHLLDVITVDWSFSNSLTRYDTRLRDNNGNPATPGKEIGYDSSGGKQSNTIFDMGDPNVPYSSGDPSRVTFVGKNTLELWYDKSYEKLTAKQQNNGVPIQGYTYGNDWSYPYSDTDGDGYWYWPDGMWVFNPSGTLSHVDTTNSLMSWQNYRNYPGFIEIELAVMQDIGYTVERRNFFGKSYYVDGDGETPTYNSTNFTFWDYEKGAYDLSKANTATYAIGTHLFANNLNVFQTGDIWTAGAGSAGVRIDGQHNQFTLTTNTSIYNENSNGIGLLVAYGRDHTVTLQKGSSVKVAPGNGYAVSFNFGTPVVGSVRSSYAYDIDYDDDGYANIFPLEELNGPLVKDFNVSGSVIYDSGEKLDSAPVYQHIGLADRVITRGNNGRKLGVLEFNFETLRIIENGELTAALTENPSADFAATCRLLVHPPYDQNDGCAVVVRHDQSISTTTRTYDPETGFVDTTVLNPMKDIIATIVPWYDTQIGDYRVVQASKLGLANTVGAEISLYIVHNTDEDQEESAIRIDIWFDEDSNSYQYGVITQSDNGDLEYDTENVFAPLYDRYSMNYAPSDNDPDFKVLFYDEDGALVNSPNHAGNSPLNSLNGDPELPILEDYDVVHLGGAVTAESLLGGYEIDTRMFFLYAEDDPNYDPLRPWTRYITADQDIVYIPSTGTAIYIDGTAHVERINIMQGASIEGDIISRYQDSEGRGTTLTFGLKADADGQATSVADADFEFVYTDNINYSESYERAYVNDSPGYFHQVTNTANGKGGDYDFDYDTGEFVYVGPGQGKYVKDLYRWGTYDYDETHGTFVEVGVGTDGVGLGRFTLTTDETLNLSSAGKIDLHFMGGYTEFYNNRSVVDTVTIDAGATFSLGALHYGNSISAARVIATGDFVNNGRFSGEGGVWVGARNLSYIRTIDDTGFVTVNGYVGTGTFLNEGTIAPGANNGADVGIMTICGDLKFTRNGVYELTIGGENEDRYHSAVLADGSFVDQSGRLYYTMNIYNEDLDHSLAWQILEDQQLIRDNPYKITGTGNDLIVVSGSTAMNGTLKINILPDSVYGNETTIHTIIQSGSFAKDTKFTKIEYDQAFLAVSPVFINELNPHEAQIKVTRDLHFFEERGKTKNEIATGIAVDRSLFDAPEIAFSLGDSRNSATDIRDLLRQMSGSIRANSASINFWSPSELLFNRIGWGNGQMETGDRGRVDWNRIARKKDRILGQGPGRMRTGSIWGDYINTNFNAESDGNAEKYNIHRNGFMIGGEWGLTPYSAIGAIASYANSKLKQHGDTAKSDDYLFGLYFVCAPRNEFEFKGYIGTGFQEYDYDRHVRNGNVYTDSINDSRGVNDRYVSDTKGNTLNVSLELARPLMLHPTFILRPTIGLDTQFLWQDGFMENNHNAYYNNNAYGSYLYGLKYKRMRLDRTLLRTGFSSETSGSRGSLRMRAFYVTRIGGDACATSDQRFVLGGDQFSIDGVRLGRNFLNLGIGTNLWMDGEKTSSFFLDYDANIYNSSRKVDAHTFSIGFLQNF